MQVSHHIHCNDLELDEDVFSAFPFLRFDARMPRKWFHKYQHIYMVLPQAVSLYMLRFTCMVHMDADMTYCCYCTVCCRAPVQFLLRAYTTASLFNVHRCLPVKAVVCWVYKQQVYIQLSIGPFYQCPWSVAQHCCIT